jgi:hypothetical protein
VTELEDQVTEVPQIMRKLAEMTDLAEDWAIRCKEAQIQLRAAEEGAKFFHEIENLKAANRRLADIIMDEYPSTDHRYIFAEKQV